MALAGLWSTLRTACVRTCRNLSHACTCRFGAGRVSLALDHDARCRLSARSLTAFANGATVAESVRWPVLWDGMHSSSGGASWLINQAQATSSSSAPTMR